MRGLTGVAYIIAALAVFSLFGAQAALADDEAIPLPAEQSADKMPIRILHNVRRIEVNPDFTYTIHHHNETKLLDQAAIARLSQLSLSYSESLQKLTIDSAYTLKADGRKLEVKPEAIITRQKTSPNPNVHFADTMQKVVLFPDVEAGDTLVFDATFLAKPVIPGFFVFSLVTPKTLPIDNDEVTIAVPKTMALHIDRHDYEMKMAVSGDRNVYSFSYSNPHPVLHDDQYVSNSTRAPRVFVSTYQNYAQFAAAIDTAIRDRIIVTPEILAKADAITAGVSDRREQARKIYEWVSTRVRYVALEFGVGSIVPHPAAEVMQNAYGDCKDHAVLLAALLKAKGIESNVVLINVAPAYVLPAVPTLAFNHAINWLPEFGLYADTTQGQLPFGILPYTEYGKPVVRLGAKDGALAFIPQSAKKDASVRVSGSFKLDDNGVLHGENDTTVEGPLAGTFRKLGVSLAASAETTAKETLKKLGYDEATGRFDFPQNGGIEKTYRFSAKFEAKKQQRMLSGKSFRLPIGLTLISTISESFLGPIVDKKYRNADPAACYSGHASEDISFEFPKSKKLAELPKDAHIEDGSEKKTGTSIKFDAHWSLEGNTLHLHRDLDADFVGTLCEGPRRSEAVKAIDKIRENYKTEISLQPIPVIKNRN